MQNYVVNEPPEMVSQLNRIVTRIRLLWNEKNFRDAELLFREYYEIMRAYEDSFISEGYRFHKSVVLHDWGISILLQEDLSRTEEAIEKIILSYIEDLLDFDSLEQVHSAAAYKTLSFCLFDGVAMGLASSQVQELRKTGRIPRDTRLVLTDQLNKTIKSAIQKVNMNKLKTVFVVNGRNTEARDSLHAFLKSIGLISLNLPEALFQSGIVIPYLDEMLDLAFSLGQAVVVLMTPDDVGCLRKPFRKPEDPIYETKFSPQARLNVVFKAGLAMGGRFQKRTLLVELGSLREISERQDLSIAKLTNSTESRQGLIDRLKSFGCIVSTLDDSWQKAGDFESVLIIKEGFLSRR